MAWGRDPLEASLLPCLGSSQDDQSVALLTIYYSWSFHGARLPHGMAALGWLLFSQWSVPVASLVAQW